MNYLSGALIHPCVSRGLYAVPEQRLVWAYNNYLWGLVYPGGIQFWNNSRINTGSGMNPGPPNSSNYESYYNEVRWVAIG
jgi:hypothetical protein